jgi:hypothetical protein
LLRITFRIGFAPKSTRRFLADIASQIVPMRISGRITRRFYALGTVPKSDVPAECQ